MKFKTFFLLLGLLCSNILLAQNPKVDLSDIKMVEKGDSVVLTMGMKVGMDEMPSRNQIRLVPFFKSAEQTVDVKPMVLLNGKKMHGMYKRQSILDERKGERKDRELAYEYKGGQWGLQYRGAVALEQGKRAVDVYVLLQMLDANGAVIHEKILPGRVAKTKENNNSQQTSAINSQEKIGTAVLGAAANDVVDLKQDFSVVYKGSYIEPASDEIFERNQKELRFSLDEAKVIAEINPHMLSLRELYAVAQSYEGRPAMFHKIIKKSVELYPSNPIANLNAAASAIELRDVNAAASFLQAAPHDTLAYINCKGAYELMRNNVQEGLRLLKLASAKGSEEANQNLKIFFGSFKEE